MGRMRMPLQHKHDRSTTQLLYSANYKHFGQTCMFDKKGGGGPGPPPPPPGGGVLTPLPPPGGPDPLTPRAPPGSAPECIVHSILLTCMACTVHGVWCPIPCQPGGQKWRRPQSYVPQQTDLTEWCTADKADISMYCNMAYGTSAYLPSPSQPGATPSLHHNSRHSSEDKPELWWHHNHLAGFRSTLRHTQRGGGTSHTRAGLWICDCDFFQHHT